MVAPPPMVVGTATLGGDPPGANGCGEGRLPVAGNGTCAGRSWADHPITLDRHQQAPWPLAAALSLTSAGCQWTIVEVQRVSPPRSCLGPFLGRPTAGSNAGLASLSQHFTHSHASLARAFHSALGNIAIARWKSAAASAFSPIASYASPRLK